MPVWLKIFTCWKVEPHKVSMGLYRQEIDLKDRDLVKKLHHLYCFSCLVHIAMMKVHQFSVCGHNYRVSKYKMRLFCKFIFVCVCCRPKLIKISHHLAKLWAKIKHVCSNTFCFWNSLAGYQKHSVVLANQLSWKPSHTKNILIEKLRHTFTLK